MAQVSCFEIKFKLSKPRRVLIGGGDTPSQASSQQYRNNNPSKALCSQLLNKLSQAISGGSTSITVNVDAAGTITEDLATSQPAPRTATVTLVGLAGGTTGPRQGKAGKKGGPGAEKKSPAKRRKKTPKKPEKFA
jgi:hypothetical protein